MARAYRVALNPDGAPHIVAIIPLSEDIDTQACIQALRRCIDEETHGINESTNIWTMKTSQFKTSLQILPVPFTSSADSLVSTNVTDDMANEQTWLTEEEMAGALQGTGDGKVPDAKKGTMPKRIKHILKGKTEYQASWIIDESEDEDQDEDRDWEGRLIDEDEEMVLDDALDMENLHHGASAPRKNKTPKNFQMKLIPHKTSLHPGTHMTIFIEGVPQEASMPSKSPFVPYGLLKHKHKKTVLHFTVQRNTECKGSVRSKVGCLLRINLVYSQHTRGGGKGANNVHKFKRFLWHSTTTVVSIYALIAFRKQPCMLLRETTNPQTPELVAMGTFMNPDTTCIIMKQIILTSHLFKVHKKTATVWYMFFNPDDIQYFKPIQLFTKHGRTGYIRESLGMHAGHATTLASCTCAATRTLADCAWFQTLQAGGSSSINASNAGTIYIADIGMGSPMTSYTLLLDT
ncbi:hypothetical protein EDD22DRAFT_1008253 [Suillus occidentalis]|nr:hypothetical protein EDD22DRAFT_1008253 [Suillus occidentalis]